MNPTLTSDLKRQVVMGLGTIVLVLSTAIASSPTKAAGDPGSALVRSNAIFIKNPGVVPNLGNLYGDLGAQWWQWAFSFPYAKIPFFNKGGPVDVDARQSGPVWFLAGANDGLNSPRTGVVPAGTPLFLPIANLINDYPCPPSFGFEPNPGESLEDFLQRTADDFFPNLTDLFAEIDGVSLRHLESYRAMSSMFKFTADPAAVSFDPCITGRPQRGVAVGYWLLLAPLPPGQHTLRFGAPSWGQDVTYVLTVKPWR